MSDLGPPNCEKCGYAHVPSLDCSSWKDNPKPYYFDLFQHMSNNHGLTLLDSELEDIVQVARKYDSSPDTIAVPRELVMNAMLYCMSLARNGYIRNPTIRKEIEGVIAQLEALLK